MFDSAAQEAAGNGLKKCSMCGQLTKSRFDVCNREGTPCRAEYQRRWNLEQDKAHRNEVVRRYRIKMKKAPSVYAILFPVAGVLKVGLTTTACSAQYIGGARVGARKRGWSTGGSSSIWTRPGDVRTEAWIQATLSFRWPGAFVKYQNRVCEWFDISGLTVDAIVATLDEIYQDVPVDRIPEAMHSTTVRDIA